MLPLIVAACFSPTGSATSGVGSASTTDSAGTAGSTETDSATSSTAGDPGDSEPVTSQADTTSDSATNTTTAPICGELGAPCGGGCCGCLTCDGDSKTCVADDSACAVMADETCSSMIWGPLEGGCFRYAGAQGTCDATGACVPGACAGQGDLLANCASAECQRQDVCIPDTPAAEITFGSLCVTDEHTEKCGESCTGGTLGGQVELRICDVNAQCVLAGSQSCGGYVCADNGKTCKSSCFNKSDCGAGYTCVNAQYEPA